MSAGILLPQVIFGHYLGGARTAPITAVLWLCTVPAFGQDIRLSNDLLDRARAGKVQDQLEVARADCTQHGALACLSFAF